MKVATTLVIASLFVIALGMPAHAGHDSIEETGLVLVGSPEPVLATPCEVGEDLHGVSYDVSGFDGHSFNIQPLATLDVDPVFYDADCDEIPGNGGAPLGFLGAREFGIVPDDAAYLYVWGFAGTGTFDLEV